ncbi:MAG: hypothetical protein QJR02_02000 [Sinobacteraceae bacterium]|nr:hypothetical protein [Nevskiaceae bacterium]
MQKIVTFKAVDGRIFPDELSCLEYEARLQQIDRFMNSSANPAQGPRQRALVLRVLLAWERFRKNPEEATAGDVEGSIPPLPKYVRRIGDRFEARVRYNDENGRIRERSQLVETIEQAVVWQQAEYAKLQKEGRVLSGNHGFLQAAGGDSITQSLSDRAAGSAQNSLELN